MFRTVGFLGPLATAVRDEDEDHRCSKMDGFHHGCYHPNRSKCEGAYCDLQTRIRCLILVAREEGPAVAVRKSRLIRWFPMGAGDPQDQRPGAGRELHPTSPSGRRSSATGTPHRAGAVVQLAARRTIDSEITATRRRIRSLRQHWVPQLTEAFPQVEFETGRAGTRRKHQPPLGRCARHSVIHVPPRCRVAGPQMLIWVRTAANVTHPNAHSYSELPNPAS